MPGLTKALGHRYFQATTYSRQKLSDLDRPVVQPGQGYKSYPNAPRVVLPAVKPERLGPLGQALQSRRSERSFDPEVSISLEELALLLWAMQGVTGQAGPYLLRTAPSAGALYPIETYVAVERVDHVSPGIYHFDVRDFALAQISEGPPGQDVAAAALGQKFCGQTAINIIWTAVFRRNMAKYGHRGMRYILMDVGHIGQNLVLAAASLDLGSCPVAAFFDDELNGLLGVDGQEESALYLASVGRPLTRRLNGAFEKE